MPRKTLPKLDYCQNCGGPTPGNYCEECGQDSREHRVSMRLLLFGLWNDLFTFDSRFFRSFLPLLFRPGRLTREYIDGRRVRFIPPVRLYLFVSILFFFLITILFKGTADEAARGIRDGMADSTVVILPEEAGASLDSIGMATLADSIGIAVGEAIAESIAENDDEDDGMANVSIFGHEGRVREEDMGAFMLNLAPKSMFVLLPIFASLLALVYIRSGKMFIEHFIFTLHYQSYIFLLQILVLIFVKITDWNWTVLLIIPCIHLYLLFAMKRVYRQKWGKTILKHFLLTSAYNLIFLVFMSITLAAGAAMAVLAEDYPWLTTWFGG